MRVVGVFMELNVDYCDVEKYYLKYVI